MHTVGYAGPVGLSRSCLARKGRDSHKSTKAQVRRRNQSEEEKYSKIQLRHSSDRMTSDGRLIALYPIRSFGLASKSHPKCLAITDHAAAIDNDIDLNGSCDYNIAFIIQRWPIVHLDLGWLVRRRVWSLDLMHTWG